MSTAVLRASPVAAAAVRARRRRTRRVRSEGAVREASVPRLRAARARRLARRHPVRQRRQAPDDVVLSRKTPGRPLAGRHRRRVRRGGRRGRQGLIAAGLRPGDRLAIMARTTYEWTLLDFAGLGGRPGHRPRSTRPPPPSRPRWILQDSGAAACVVENVEQARLVTGRAPAAARPARTCGSSTRARSASCAPRAATVPDAVVAARRAGARPDTLATLIYTSGTTGRPKGCVLTHGNFFAEVDNAIELLHPVFRSVSNEPASTLLFLPLSPRLRPDGRGRLPAGPGPARARARASRTDDLLADLAGVPADLPAGHPVRAGEGLQHRPRHGREDGPGRLLRPRRPASPGATARRSRPAEHGTGPGPRPRPAAGPRAVRPAGLPPDPGRARRQGEVRDLRRLPAGPPARRLLRGRRREIFEGYGLTETTAAATVTPPLRPRLGTVGWPLPGTAVRIADDGEVLLRGGQVFARLLERGAPAGRVPARPPGDGWFADRRPRRAGRRRLSDHHRPQEGDHHHGRRQERRARAAGGLAAGAPADRPVHGGRRQPPVRHRADHPGAGRPRALAPDAQQGGLPARPAHRPTRS